MKRGSDGGLAERRASMRFTVTVDTEADAVWWCPDEIRLENLRQLPRFQDLCDEFGIEPAYLVTYECAHRDEALAVLQPLAAARRCEIGHHLHVWTCPPFGRGDGDVDREWLLAHQFRLPDALFAEKAERLRQEIERNFGRSPTAHRAGRWGIDQRTIDWLYGAGFLVDTSLRPSIALPAKLRAHGAVRPGFERNVHMWPVGSQDAGPQAGIVEIPVTVDFPDGPAARLCRRWLSAGAPLSRFPERLYRRLGGQRMLRPNPRYAPGELPRICDAAADQGVTVLNLMLHSSELAIGCSPFSMGAGDTEAVWSQLKQVFAHVRDAGIEPRSLTRLATEARGQISPHRAPGAVAASAAASVEAGRASKLAERA